MSIIWKLKSIMTKERKEDSPSSNLQPVPKLRIIFPGSKISKGLFFFSTKSARLSILRFNEIGKAFVKFPWEILFLYTDFQKQKLLIIVLMKNPL